MAPAYNLSTQEAEVEGLYWVWWATQWLPDQSGRQSQTLFQETKKKQNNPEIILYKPSEEVVKYAVNFTVELWTDFEPWTCSDYIFVHSCFCFYHGNK